MMLFTARLSRSRPWLFTGSVLLVVCLGCRPSQPVQIQGEQNSAKKIENVSTNKEQEIVFHDKVQSNAEVPKGLDGLVFLDTGGNRVAMEEFIGKKNVVLIFTEGFAGMLCPFCKTQTSRLVSNYEKFVAEDAEILVVYPGTRDHVDEFMEAARTTDKTQVESVPFPILLDEDFGATDFFNIRAKHAHPSTFIVDKKGNVRLAYVGADMSADRPSVDAMLDVLRTANAP